MRNIWKLLAAVAIVGGLKQESIRELWIRYPDWFRHHFWKEHTFWSDGYFVCSIGEASPETVRKYIENQG
ncbi:MAG: transposase [Bacteroidales bacterium]|nr:transposase [Bacteroidales bacterium]